MPATFNLLRLPLLHHTPLLLLPSSTIPHNDADIIICVCHYVQVVGKGGFGKVNAAMRAEDPSESFIFFIHYIIKTFKVMMSLTDHVIMLLDWLLP
jgi:hypothetical protein